MSSRTLPASDRSPPALHISPIVRSTPAYGNPPTVILGPGEPDMAHKTDEYCLVSKIEAAADVYTEIAKRWCHLSH